MNVKTCVQNNSIHIIPHNYMNNGRTINQIKQLNLREDDNEDCSVDYLFLLQIGVDNTYQSLTCGRSSSCSSRMRMRRKVSATLE